MNWQEIGPQVQKLNNGILGLMEQISSMVKKDSRYPKTSGAFDSAYSHLKHPAYDIVVCGEVKKGKSTLLNAIIGQKILPVNVNVATSQVFRISNSASESFSLVFTDGTTQPITRNQLADYGSQVNINQNGGNSLGDRILSHIQVNIPVQFLPENVNLVDTPGLGAVYKSHEWITQNYVKKAAAVLFVFDATQPMVDLEKTFINKILDITPHVMYVMTKIDSVNKIEWTVQMKRIEDGLADIYKTRNLKAPKVFPVSSSGLMDAAVEKDAGFKMDNVQTSLFPAVKEELMSMILRAVAMSYPTMALYEAQGHVMKAKNVITDLLNAASANGQELDQQFKSRKLTKQQELQEEWGRNSKRTKEISNQITNLCNIVNNRVDQMFRLTSPIREHYVSHIDSINTMDEVKAMSEKLPSAVAGDIAQQWDSIMRDALNETNVILQTAISDMDRFSISGCGDMGGISTLKLTASQKLGNVRSILGTGMLAATVATMVFPPLGGLIGIGSAIWALIAGKKDEIQRNKNNMKSELSKIMDKISHTMKDARGYNQPSIVGEFVGNLKNHAEQALQGALDSKKQEMQNQLQTLEEQARMDIDKKRQECDSLRAELANCDKLVQATSGLVALRESIKRQIV